MGQVLPVSSDTAGHHWQANEVKHTGRLSRERRIGRGALCDANKVQIRGNGLAEAEEDRSWQTSDRSSGSGSSSGWTKVTKTKLAAKNNHYKNPGGAETLVVLRVFRLMFW